VTIPRSKPRAHSSVLLAKSALALLGLASFGGCLVSFDGYQLGDLNGGASGAEFVADAAGKGGHIGSSQAGSATGGSLASGDAGASGEVGVSLGGASSAGDHAGGRTSSGGDHSGGRPNGGASNGGSHAGGANNGGTSNGGDHAGGASSGGSGVAGSGGGKQVCPETHQRIQVEIPLPNGGFYCIDRGEVKNVEYQAFLDAQTGTSGQPSACAFNTSFQPDTLNGCTQFDPVNLKNQPVACVDWCDAAAYCKWEGKHLCAKIGGGSNPPATFADATKSEWYRACSHAGDFQLPYGSPYDGMRCVGLDNTAVRPLAVPNTNCEGGYSGLYDMSGNVAEWEDSCAGDTGASDQCLARGGSYLDTNQWVGSAPSLVCDSSGKMATKSRSTRDKEIGFRCCSDPVNAP